MTNSTSYNQQTLFNNLQQPVNSTSPFVTTSSFVSSTSAITDPYKAFERLGISDNVSKAPIFSQQFTHNQKSGAEKIKRGLALRETTIYRLDVINDSNR